MKLLVNHQLSSQNVLPLGECSINIIENCNKSNVYRHLRCVMLKAEKPHIWQVVCVLKMSKQVYLYKKKSCFYSI